MISLENNKADGASTECINTLENSDFLNFRRTGKTKFSGVPETLSVSQDAQKPSQNSLSVFDIYGSSGSSKKVCNTAINMCKTMDYSLGLTPQLAVEIVL